MKICKPNPQWQDRSRPLLVPFLCVYVFAAPSRSHLEVLVFLFWPLSSALLFSPCAHCLSSVPPLTSAAYLSWPRELQTPALQGTCLLGHHMHPHVGQVQCQPFFCLSPHILSFQRHISTLSTAPARNPSQVFKSHVQFITGPVDRCF